MRVRFYYDVVCPYSYLETHAVEAAEDSGDVEVEWLRPYYEKAWRRSVAERSRG